LDFQRGELVVLAARPAMGKSALALNFATNACQHSNASVAFLSLEMGMDQLVMRLLSSHAGIDLSKIRGGNLTPNEMTQLLLAKHKIDKYQLYLDESSTTELGEIAASMSEIKKKFQTRHDYY
jgi:replicative DNA helicase